MNRSGRKNNDNGRNMAFDASSSLTSSGRTSEPYRHWNYDYRVFNLVFIDDFPIHGSDLVSPIDDPHSRRTERRNKEINAIESWKL